MKKYSMLGIVFFILLFIPMAHAVKPITDVQVPELGDYLTILYANNDYHEAGTEFDMYFQVFNSSNFLLTTDEVSCISFFYNHDFGDDLWGAIPTEATGTIFLIEFNTTVTAQKGNLEFDIICNTSKEAGFVSDYITLNELGDEPADPGALIGIMFIPLILAFVLMMGAGTMGENHSVLKIFLFLLSYVSVLFALWFGTILTVNLYGLVSLQEGMGIVTFILSLIFFALIAYFIFYAVYQTRRFLEQRKKEKEDSLEY